MSECREFTSGTPIFPTPFDQARLDTFRKTDFKTDPRFKKYWYTVEGGQGGPSKGYDSLERKQRTWKQPGMQGWISLRGLLAADKPVPYWQGGRSKMILI